MNLVHYNYMIYGCLFLIVILGVVALYYEYLREWSNLGIGIAVAVILTLLAFKLDQSSARKFFVIYDDKKRKILEILEEEKEYDEKVKLLAGEKKTYPTKTQLDHSLDKLKEVGLIKERKETILGKGKVTKYRQNL